MKNFKEIIFDDPSEVIAQLEAYGWLIGQAHEFCMMDEKVTHGLYCLICMIQDNVESMIDKLEK